MNATDAIRILARWNTDLRRDLRIANRRIKRLELRLGIEEAMPLDDLYGYWLDHHTPAQIVALAGELEAVT